MDLDRAITQEAFGGLVGITQPAVADLMRRGVLRPGQTAHQWLLAYTGKLRDEAAGRSVDLVHERMLLDRARREHQEMVNAKLRRELLPVGMLEEILVEVARRIAGILERVDVQLRREAGLEGKARAIVAQALVRARNEAATLTLPLDELADDVRRRQEMQEASDGSIGDITGDRARAETVGGDAAVAAQSVG